VKAPDRITRQRRRLFPPPVLLEQIEPLIAIDVAKTHAVRELAVFVVR